MSADNEVEAKTLFGFWLYILSDIILFSVLFATYAVLRTTSVDWIPLPRALGETLLLLVSSFVCGFCRGPKPLLFLGLTCLLGIVFATAVFADFAHLMQNGSRWDTNAILSAYFLLVGTLWVHVLAGILWMIVLMVQIWQRGITPATMRRCSCLQMFWHFLNIVWVGIYSWIYLMR